MEGECLFWVVVYTMVAVAQGGRTGRLLIGGSVVQAAALTHVKVSLGKILNPILRSNI